MDARRHLAAVAVVAATACPALAQEAPPSARPGQQAPEQRARELHEQGLAQYERGSLDQAIASFRAAHALFPSPGFLFNIGQAYEQKGDCVRARDHYRESLKAGPSAANLARVEARLAAVETCADHASRASTPSASSEANAAPAPSSPEDTAPPVEADPAPPPAVRDVREGHRWPLGPTVVGVAGLAAAGAGAFMLVSVGGDLDGLRETCAPRCPPSSTDSLRSRATVGHVLVGVGAGAVALAVMWWLWGRSDVPSDRRALVSAEGAGVRF
jgi:hypothetical protein